MSPPSSLCPGRAPGFPSRADRTVLPQGLPGSPAACGEWRAALDRAGAESASAVAASGKTVLVLLLELNWSWRVEINRASLFTGLLRSNVKISRREGFVLNLVDLGLLPRCGHAPSRRLGGAALEASGFRLLAGCRVLLSRLPAPPAPVPGLGLPGASTRAAGPGPLLGLGARDRSQ